ncbi:B3 domain-containing protein [Quillaja saponaria]|uniref:B3 domain-containing protein n=1 Tax=Quillaja saponaria TaxID=32244 RepID=A0AAD7QAT7_QUISA|nr:B3 domain-containing protein [Quillaja saponaria]
MQSRDTDQFLEFFKVFLPNSSSQHMRIPPAFVKKFNGVVPKEATVVDCAGTSWYMGLEETENGLYFGKGWKEFVNENSLKYGDFLAFEYNGKSMFHVKIFGKTGCRKEKHLSGVKIVPHVVLDDDNESDQAQRMTPQSCKRKQETGLTGNGSSEESTCKSRKVSEANMEDSKALITPKNPQFVLVYGSPTSRYRVYVPRTVLRDSNVKPTTRMILCDEDGKSWPMDMQRVKDGRIYIRAGWIEFVNSRGGKEMQVQIIRQIAGKEM